MNATSVKKGENVRNIKLKKAILESRDTQKMIAKKAGIPEGSMLAYVGGWRTPRIRRQKILAQLLGKTREELFDNE